MSNKFTTEQVKALFGGSFPTPSGFAWGLVEYFLFEDGLLQPYSGSEILPGPAINVAIAAMPSRF